MKLSATIPMSREARIDMGIATEAEIAEDAAAVEAALASWNAQPWHRRAWLKIRIWWWAFHVRPYLEHVGHALRGRDCEL